MASTAIGANGHGLGLAGPPWPEPIDQRAYHGVAGQIVRELGPYTEADPVGILAVLLAGCGNWLGDGIYCQVSGKRHGLRVYPVLVGETGLGRKGTAQAAAEAVLRAAKPGWFGQRRVSGLASGEGLIYQVRDAVTKQEPIRDKGKNIVGYQDVIDDSGVTDKRLFVVEEEFGRVIRVLSRDNNTLSAVLRDAWDGNALRSLVKNPYGTAEAHVTIVGHITPVELARYLTTTEAANGFGNRFVWLLVRKAGDVDDEEALNEGQLGYLGDLLAGALDDAREHLSLLRRDDEARALWQRTKPLLERRRAGLVGAVTGRATVQVVRLSAIYAALEAAPRIGRAHLEAALALWRYAEDSAMCTFGDSQGDPIADTIIQALRERARTQTELSNLFNRHVPAEQLADTLELLEDRGLVRHEEQATRGRPRTVWHLAEPVERRP